jgi:hypothetical protein
MRCLKAAAIAVLLLLGETGVLSGRAPFAVAQSSAGEVQARTWRTALIPAEQSRYSQLRRERGDQLGQSFSDILIAKHTPDQIDAYAKANSDRMAVLAGMLGRDFDVVRAGKDAAAANPSAATAARRNFVANLAELDARQAFLPTIKVYSNEREQQKTRLANAAAAKAFAGALPPPPSGPPAWMTAMPGYRPTDAAAFARCTSDNSRCLNTCAAHLARVGDARSAESCRQSCKVSNDSCVQHIRWSIVERPDNTHNPLTRFYKTYNEIYADPNYGKARNAWMSCLYKNTSNSDMKETERCRSLNPDNAVRP